MHRLLADLGHPEAAAPVLHVAGTKGKGSTATMLASIMSASGYRTALYTRLSCPACRGYTIFNLAGPLASSPSTCPSQATSSDH